MAGSYMRPRNTAFPAFQERAGVIVYEALSRSLSDPRLAPAAVVGELNGLYRELNR